VSVRIPGAAGAGGARVAFDRLGARLDTGTRELAGQPRVFVTLAAHGFGAVHTRRERDGQVRTCRPRRTPGACPYGVPLDCPA
jgi:hypothetical protein